MKKNLLLAAAMLLTSVASFAWEKPSAPASQPMVTTEIADTAANYQYLWNTAGGFFLGANDYNTRASVSMTLGHKVCFVSTSETTGSDTYAIINRVLKFGDWRKTFCDNNASIWVDNNSGANCDYWTITPADGGDNWFSIANENLPDDGFLGVQTDLSNTRLYLQSWFEAQDPAVEATCTWYSVSEEEYQAFLAKSLQYDAAVKLAAAIEAAEAEYPGIDLSAQKAVYDNESSTTEELNAATESISDSIKAYLIEKLKEATVDNPVDATGFLTNPSFENGDLTGWTVSASGNLGTSSDCGAKQNSNATYATDNADGEYLFNIWSWGYPITQSVKGLPSGIYQLTAGVCSSDDCTNVYITANGYMTNREGNYIGTLRKAVTLEANEDGSKQQHLTDGSLYFPVEADSLTIGAVGCDADGVSYLATGRWWYKADNFRLMYYGNDDAAYKLLQEEDFGNLDVDPDETFAMRQLLEDYCSARDDFYEGTSADQIYGGLKGMFVLADSVTANIAAYEAYSKEITSAREEVNGKTGAYVDLVNEYLDDQEALEPGYEASSVEGYVFTNGNYGYILENRQLTTPEMTNEETYVEKLVADMLKNTAEEGDDFTSALKNPTFADANGAGWTWTKTRVTNFMKTGGYTDFPCAEAWHGSYLIFDVSQTVTGVPDGLYKINANAFYRPNGNGDVDPDNQDINAYIYMNDFESKVKHIAAEGISSDDWDAGRKDEVICGQPLSNTSQGWYLNEALGIYYPNGMKSASQAFSMGMYEQTVYGLVEGGTMKLGIHKTVDDSNVYSNDQWCLWTNFKLTYMAQNAEAVDAVCEKLLEDANYIESYQADKLVNEAYDALDAAVNDVQTAASGTDEKYQAMKALNTAIKNAREAILLYDECKTALASVNSAIDSAPEGQDEDLIAEASSYVETTDATLTALEITIAEMKEVIEKCNYYVGRLQIVGDWTKATNDDPTTWVTLSPVFNYNFDAGNANGWTDTYTTGNHGYQSNATYEGTDGESRLDKFYEAWRSGNAALEDGKFSTTIDSTGYSFLPVLPAGEYTLTADVNSKNQGDATITGGAFLFVTVGGETYKTESATTAEELVHKVSVDFTIPADGTAIELGVMTESTKYNWVGADNFKLVIRQYGAGLKGDVNGDGTVDIADVNAILTVMFSEEGYSKAADVNGDGDVDIADVNAVLTIIFTED